MLIDGTNCTLVNKTNIGSIYQLSSNAGYDKIYSTGIGAVSRTPITDICLAPNLEPKALEIYQSLLDLGLESNDRIFIFGYSRGAVVARTLAMCIASKDSYKAAARKSGDYRAIQAQIEFLCLFDPVVGWPRIHRTYVENHNAALELRVKNYVELLSYGERRVYMSSDSYIASKATKAKLQLATSARNTDSTKDRRSTYRDLELRKSRKCIWFPGNHSDIGGDGSDQSQSAHTLATALEELMIAAERAGVDMKFPPDELSNLVWGGNDDIEPVEPKSKNRFAKLISRAFGALSGRKPEESLLIPHLAHPTCKKSDQTYSLAEALPEYPGYQRVPRQHN